MNRTLLSGVAALALASGAAADPFKPSKGQQLSLGLRAAEEIRKKERVLPDSDPRVKLLRRVASRLLATDAAKAVKDAPWKYSFDVIESKEINAFALPGGPVFFYTGLLDRMTSEDEVAGVLGHELTHVQKEHWAYAYRDSMKANGLLVLASVFGAPRDVVRLGSITNDMLLETSFSRKHERESDENGFKMMTQAGYNPEGMARTFETLKRLGGGGAPEFLATHPDSGRRVQFIRDLARKGNRSYPAETPLNLPRTSADADRRRRNG